MLAAVSHRSTGQHLRLVNGFSSRTMCKAGKDAFSVGGRWVRLSAAVRIECLEGVTGGKAPSEYMFSELPQVADIVRSAFHHLANPLVLRITAF